MNTTTTNSPPPPPPPPPQFTSSLDYWHTTTDHHSSTSPLCTTTSTCHRDSSSSSSSSSSSCILQNPLIESPAIPIPYPFLSHQQQHYSSSSSSSRKHLPNKLNLLKHHTVKDELNVVSPLLIWQEHDLNSGLRPRSFSTNSALSSSSSSSHFNPNFNSLLSPPVFGSCSLFQPLPGPLSTNGLLIDVNPSTGLLTTGYETPLAGGLLNDVHSSSGPLSTGLLVDPCAAQPKPQPHHVLPMIQQTNPSPLIPVHHQNPLTSPITVPLGMLPTPAVDFGEHPIAPINPAQPQLLAQSSYPRVQSNWGVPTPNATPDPYAWMKPIASMFRPSPMYLEMPHSTMNTPPLKHSAIKTPPLSQSPPITPPEVLSMNIDHLLVQPFGTQKNPAKAHHYHHQPMKHPGTKRKRAASCMDKVRPIYIQPLVAVINENDHESACIPPPHAGPDQQQELDPVPPSVPAEKTSGIKRLKYAVKQGETKPFVCAHEGCEAKFARNHDLKRHELIHSGVKVFECKECGRAFGRRDALARHTSAPGNRCKTMVNSHKKRTAKMSASDVEEEQSVLSLRHG